jgi:hypothetical protein
MKIGQSTNYGELDANPRRSPNAAMARSGCPAGKSLRFIGSLFEACQAALAKISHFRFSEICGCLPAVPPHKRGVSRSSRTLAAGGDGRIKRARRARSMRTAKPCGPDTPMLVSSSVRRIAERWWLTSPVHQGERGAAVKTIAQGMPDCLGCPVAACVRKVHLLCTQGSRVRPASGIPCAL